MNSDELKLAIDRRRAHAAACDADAEHESPYYDDTGMLGDDAELLADAYLAAPQWRDKPTCAGLYVVRSGDTYGGIATLVKLTADEIERGAPWHFDELFGPIPERPAT